MKKPNDKDDKMKSPIFGNIVEKYDVCEVCNWENTGFINIDDGPDEMTLEEAKKAHIMGKTVR